MVLALSLQTDIKSIGAYAGFAAIIGLALLVVLYFAQARETRRLTDLIEEQEARLRSIPAPATAVVARPMVVPQPGLPPRPAGAPMPTPATPPVATVAIPGARRVAVAATTVVAAPAASSATVVSTPPPAVEPADAETALSTAAQGAPPAGAIAPATAAGALSNGPDAAADATESAAETSDSQQLPGIVVARRVPLAEALSVSKAAQAETETVTKPPPAIPLVAGRPASAEPLGRAQAFERSSADGGEGGDTSETAVVSLDPPAGSRERTQDSPVAEPEPFPFAPDGEAARAREARREERSASEPGEAAPLAPATAAGARTRYPPAPAALQERAAPVGATARASGAAVGAEAAPTRRRDRREPPDGDSPGTTGGSAGSPVRLIAVAVVLVGVLIFAASQLFSGGSGGKATTTNTTTTRSSAGPPPASVTVAVLNGTHQSGLATHVSGTLVSEGFKRGAIANAPSQDHVNTVIAYTPGNRQAAIEVALDLALTPAQVRVADAATTQAATAQGVVPTAIVVLGSTYAQQ